MLFSKIRKIMYTPVNPSFTIKKWGWRGSNLYRHVFVMWLFCGGFSDKQYLYKRTTKVLTRLRGCAGSPESSLFAYSMIKFRLAQFVFYLYLFFFFLYCTKMSPQYKNQEKDQIKTVSNQLLLRSRKYANII